MQDSPQQRVVNLKRHCRQIHEGVCRAQAHLEHRERESCNCNFQVNNNSILFKHPFCIISSQVSLGIF